LVFCQEKWQEIDIFEGRGIENSLEFFIGSSYGKNICIIIARAQLNSLVKM
jgi:hypothetical protein